MIWPVAVSLGLIVLAWLAIKVWPQGPVYPISNQWLFGFDPEWTKHLLILVAAANLILWPLAWRYHDRLKSWANGLIGAMAANPGRFLIGLALGLIPLTVFIALYVLQNFPNSVDEYGYLFQAKTFAQGRLWNEVHPIHDQFAMSFIASQDGKWIIKFPVGWPIILMFGVWLKIPLWLFNPVLSALSAAALFFLARRLYDDRTAVVSTLLFAFSSFFLFNGGSYFSHTATALLMLLYTYYGVRYLEEDRAWQALLAGFLIGFAFIARYYTAVTLGLPLAAVLVMRQRSGAIKGILLVAAGAAPWLIWGVVYNYLVTGHPLTPPFLWYEHPEGLDKYLFGVTGRTITITFRYLVRTFIWTAPPLLILYAWFFVRDAFRRRLDFVDFMFAVAVISYIWYGPYAGNQYGPRYYYEAFPFMLMSVTRRLVRPGMFNLGERARRAAVSVLAAGFAVSLAMVVVHARAEQRVIWERTDIYRQVKEKGLDQAIVIIGSSTGRTRVMPRLDLARNGLEIGSTSVLYALDKGPLNRNLLKYWPDRKIYRYYRRPGRVRGSLVAIDLNKQ